MEKRVSITLCYEGEEHDFDFPAMMPIRDLEEKVSFLAPRVFQSLELEDEVFFLLSDDGFLSPDFSFNEQGVFDGARLQIKVFGES